MSSSPNGTPSLSRTVVIAAAAAASASALSSTIVFFAVAQLLRSASRVHTHNTHRTERSEAVTNTPTTARSSDASHDAAPRAGVHRQDSLFAWCLRRLSGKPISSDSSDSGSSQDDENDDAHHACVTNGKTRALGLPAPLSNRVDPTRPHPLSNTTGLAATAKTPAEAQKEARRSTLGSKGPRAYHTQDGGIITQYMSATTRLETDEHLKQRAMQRRDTVALAERRTARQLAATTTAAALAKQPPTGAMDLAVFDAQMRLAAAPSGDPRAGSVHPVATMLAQVGLESGGDEGDLARRNSQSMSLMSSAVAMPLPQNPIYRVVITGGPCSGKSTSMEYLKAEMEKVGYAVYLVPEVATMLMTGGARLWLTPEEAKEEEEEEAAKAQRMAIVKSYQQRIAKLEMAVAAVSNEWDDEAHIAQLCAVDTNTPTASDASYAGAETGKGRESDSRTEPLLSRKKITIQRVVLQLMMMLEDCFYELAAMRGKPSVIFYDRGTMDGSAYCTDAEWAEILRVTGYTDEELRDTRYDAVVHLVTAALGAEEYYTLENNATRHETREEAIAQDMATRNVWRGHFLFYVCDNSTNFETKLERVARFVRKVIGDTPTGAADGDAKDASSPMPTFGSHSTSTPSTSTVMPNDLQELAYIMTGRRTSNNHILLSPSNSRERSLSPSMGISAHGTPVPGHVGFPSETSGLDHSVLLDVNATTVGTTMMPTAGTATHRGAGRAAATGGGAGGMVATVVPTILQKDCDGLSLTSPVDSTHPFADNDSNSLHSTSPQDSDPALPNGCTAVEKEQVRHANSPTAGPTPLEKEVAAEPSATPGFEVGPDGAPRPTRRRVTLQPSDIACAAAAAVVADKQHRMGSEDSSEPAASEPSPSPDIPETARTASLASGHTCEGSHSSKPLRRQDFSGSLRLNEEDLHHSDSGFTLGASMLVSGAAASDGQQPQPPRQSSPAATFAESAAEGLQRHFMIRAMDASQIPENAVESEITLITLVPTRMEYLSETIIRVVRSGGTSASTRPVYLRRVEFARRPASKTAPSDPQRSIRNLTTRTLTRDAFFRLAQFFDPAQPLVRKQVKRFLHGFHQLSVVSFLEPEELRGAARVVCSAEVSADDLPEWIDVEEVSLIGRDVLV